MTETQYGRLSAKIRRSSGKGVARKLRADGLIPAVIYGKGQGNVMLTVSPRELRRAMDPQRKLNTFFTVTIAGQDGETVEQCVLTDFQADPIRDESEHVVLVDEGELDIDLVLKAARETGAIVTAEEHSVIGGLGGAVCETLAEGCPVPVERVGLRDVFGVSGTADELLSHFGLTPAHLVEAAERVLLRK